MDEKEHLEEDLSHTLDEINELEDVLRNYEFVDNYEHIHYTIEEAERELQEAENHASYLQHCLKDYE